MMYALLNKVKICVFTNFDLLLIQGLNIFDLTMIKVLKIILNITIIKGKYFINKSLLTLSTVGIFFSRRHFDLNNSLLNIICTIQIYINDMKDQITS